MFRAPQRHSSGPLRPLKTVPTVVARLLTPQIRFACLFFVGQRTEHREHRATIHSLLKNFFNFETGSSQVVHTSLKFVILLPQPHNSLGLYACTTMPSSACLILSKLNHTLGTLMSGSFLLTWYLKLVLVHVKIVHCFLCYSFLLYVHIIICLFILILSHNRSFPHFLLLWTDFCKCSCKM